MVGFTSLIVASYNNHHERTVELLVTAGAQANAVAQDGASPLLAASQVGNIETVRTLISAEAIVNHSTNEYGTPLIWSCKKGHLEVVKLLIGAELMSIVLLMMAIL